MPRNTKGGSKHKRKKNYVVRERKPDSICKDPDPTELEAYGKVIKAGGNRRFSVCCQKANEPAELTTIMCRIKGSFRKRIRPDDYVLVKHFGFSDQAQIIDVYNPDELTGLKLRDMWDFPEEEVVTKHQEKELYDLPEGFSDDEQAAESEDEKASEEPESDTADDSDIDIDNL